MIVPLDLGAASKYEEDIFPRAYYNAGDPIKKGSILLSSTLDEMIKIAEMGIDLNTDKRFHFNARVEYEASVNIKFSSIDLLMHWQSSSQGGKIAKSPEVSQPIHGLSPLSSGANVPCRI